MFARVRPPGSPGRREAGMLYLTPLPTQPLPTAFVLALAVACSLSNPPHPVKGKLEGHAFTRAFAVALAVAVVLLVLRRHSERSEESPHFPGERSYPSAFHPPIPDVISTEACALCRRR